MVALEVGILGLVVAHNFDQTAGSTPAIVVGSLIVVLGSLVAGVVVAGSQRHAGRSLPRKPPGPAVEVGLFRHRSRVTALILVPLLLYQVWVWQTPGMLSKLVGLVITPVLLWAAALGWVGFRYVVREDGLLVRGLLRGIVFVGLGDIWSVAVSSTEATEFRGWGLRGFGRRRGFIWRSGPGVRVTIDGGYLFLGAEDAPALASCLQKVLSGSRQPGGGGPR
jgi:hypothetical protein